MEAVRVCWHYNKKKTKVAKEADPEERAQFQNQQNKLPVERLVFIDEFGIHLAMTRNCARAPMGQRAFVAEPFVTGINISVVGALTIEGISAPMTLEGAMDGACFDCYVEKFLVRELLPGDIVILDNVKFHYSQHAINIIESAKASVLYLPAYSPDLNPIEECISKIKTILRKIKARTKRKLMSALTWAIDQITSSDIIGWFIHAGYTCSSK